LVGEPVVGGERNAVCSIWQPYLWFVVWVRGVLQDAPVRLMCVGVRAYFEDELLEVHGQGFVV
jgi:hypothetical protein